MPETLHLWIVQYEAEYDEGPSDNDIQEVIAASEAEALRKLDTAAAHAAYPEALHVSAQVAWKA